VHKRYAQEAQNLLPMNIVITGLPFSGCASVAAFNTSLCAEGIREVQSESTNDDNIVHLPQLTKRGHRFIPVKTIISRGEKKIVCVFSRLMVKLWGYQQGGEIMRPDVSDEEIGMRCFS
jgi:hypothetical protein